MPPRGNATDSFGCLVGDGRFGWALHGVTRNGVHSIPYSILRIMVGGGTADRAGARFFGLGHQEARLLLFRKTIFYRFCFEALYCMPPVHLSASTRKGATLFNLIRRLLDLEFC